MNRQAEYFDVDALKSKYAGAFGQDTISKADPSIPLLVWLFKVFSVFGKCKNAGTVVTNEEPSATALILAGHIGFTSVVRSANNTRTIYNLDVTHDCAQRYLDYVFNGKTVGIYFKHSDNHVPTMFFLAWLHQFIVQFRQKEANAIELYDIPVDYLLLFLYFFPRTETPVKVTMVKQELALEHVPLLLKMNLSKLTMVHPGFPVSIVLDSAPKTLDIEIWDTTYFWLADRHYDMNISVYIPEGSGFDFGGLKRVKDPHWVIFPNSDSLKYQ